MQRYFQRFSRSKYFIELRLLRGSEVRRHWLRAEEIGDNELDQLQLMNSYSWEIYAGVNPRPHSSPNAAEIVALHADVDGIPKKTDLPEPSLLVNSGHGYHLYWELQEAVAPRQKITNINRGLALAVGGDPHCCDLTRILRVPGMMNNKEPKRPVTIEAESDRRYQVEDFEHLENTEGSASTPHKVVSTGPSGLSFAEVVRKDDVLRRAMRGGYDDGASGSRFPAILRLNAHGFSIEEIEEIIGNKRWYNLRSKKVTPRDRAIADVRRVLGVNEASEVNLR